MCYTATVYHLACGHYNAVVKDACIRANSQAGLSKGCFDTVDLGIESVGSRCRTCERNDAGLTPNAGRSRLQRTTSPAQRCADFLASGRTSGERTVKKVHSNVSMVTVSSTASGGSTTYSGVLRR